MAFFLPHSRKTEDLWPGPVILATYWLTPVILAFSSMGYKNTSTLKYFSLALIEMADAANSQLYAINYFVLTYKNEFPWESKSFDVNFSLQ